MTPTMPTAAELLPLLPELVLVGAAFALLMLDLFLEDRQRWITHVLAIGTLLVVGAMVALGTGGQGTVLNGMEPDGKSATSRWSAAGTALAGGMPTTSSASAAIPTPFNPCTYSAVTPCTFIPMMSSTSGSKPSPRSSLTYSGVTP